MYLLIERRGQSRREVRISAGEMTMFHSIPPAMLERMKYLETRDIEDRVNWYAAYAEAETDST